MVTQNVKYIPVSNQQIGMVEPPQAVVVHHVQAPDFVNYDSKPASNNNSGCKGCKAAKGCCHMCHCCCNLCCGCGVGIVVSLVAVLFAALVLLGHYQGMKQQFHECVNPRFSALETHTFAAASTTSLQLNFNSVFANVSVVPSLDPSETAVQVFVETRSRSPALEGFEYSLTVDPATKALVGTFKNTQFRIMKCQRFDVEVIIPQSLVMDTIEINENIGLTVMGNINTKSGITVNNEIGATVLYKCSSAGPVAVNSNTLGYTRLIKPVSQHTVTHVAGRVDVFEPQATAGNTLVNARLAMVNYFVPQEFASNYDMKTEIGDIQFVGFEDAQYLEPQPQPLKKETTPEGRPESDDFEDDDDEDWEDRVPVTALAGKLNGGSDTIALTSTLRNGVIRVLNEYELEKEHTRHHGRRHHGDDNGDDDNNGDDDDDDKEDDVVAL